MAYFWRLVSMALAAVLVFQWLLFSMVLSHDPTTSADAVPPALRDAQTPPAAAAAATAAPAHAAVATSHGPASPDGVAVSLMLQAPKWFHRRYTVMLHNVLANIPDTWKVQVFVNTAWLEKDVLPLHPGLRSLYLPSATIMPGSSSNGGSSNGGDGENRRLQKQDRSSWTVGRVTWTPLPTNMTRRKPKEIMKSTWLWESILAENVLLFGGNGALCANARSPLTDFLDLDYVGAPWMQHHGQGGDGSTHSFRHRSAMLSILHKYPPTDHDDGPDFQYFLKHLLDQSSGSTFQVADRRTTMAFGGVSDLDHAPFLLSGTQASLNWTMRDNILLNCPEIKVIFPSMHEPSCFGAHPDGAKCKESICALQDEIPPQGC